MNRLPNALPSIFGVIVILLMACWLDVELNNSAQAQNFFSNLTDNNETLSDTTAMQNEVLAPLGNPLHKLKREQLKETIERPLFSVTRRPFVEPKRAARRKQKPAPRKKRSVRYKLLGVLTDRDRSVALVKILGDGKHIRVAKGDQIHGWEVDLINRHKILLRKKGKKLQILNLYPN